LTACWARSLEHLDHVVVGAGSRDLAQQAVKLRLAHEDTDVVEGATQVVLVKLAILVDVHKLEAVLVHLQLLLVSESELDGLLGEIPGTS